MGSTEGGVVGEPLNSEAEIMRTLSQASHAGVLYYTLPAGAYDTTFSGSPHLRLRIL